MMQNVCPGHIRWTYPQGRVIARCSCGEFQVEQATDAPSFPLAVSLAVNRHIGFRPLETRLLTFKKPLPVARLEAAEAAR